jgi:predicted metalloprotease
MFTDVASNYEGAPLSDEDRELADFVSVVLADTEDTWNEIFAAENLEYPEPTLVLFSGAVESACGLAQSAVGPFYCPVDEKVYIDLSFYRDLRDTYGARVTLLRHTSLRTRWDTTCKINSALWSRSIEPNSRPALAK